MFAIKKCAWLCSCLLVLCLFACQGEQKADKTETAGAKTEKKPLIVTTTSMIGDMLRNIVKDKAEVISLMGPGVDPHYFKASQGDLKRIREADMVFYNGIFLEGKMEAILEKLAKSKPVYAVTEELGKEQLIQMTEDGLEKQYDPHVWLDTKLWASCIEVVANRLIELDPSWKAEIGSNAAALYKTYMGLHKEVKTEINSIPEASRILVTSHDAFNYFSRSYGIDVAALQGVSTVTEFGLKDVTNLVDLIVSKNVKAVFVESSVDPKHLNAVVEGCKKRDHPVAVRGPLLSDALGEDGSSEGTYEGMIRFNAKTISEGLK